MTITAGTLKGPAGVFASTDGARRTSPLFAAIANCAVEFWIRPTAIGRILRIGPTTEASSPGLDIRIDTATGWGVSKRTAAGIQGSTGPAGITLNQNYHVVVVVGDGVDNRIYVNGVAITLTHGAVARAGALAILSSDELAIGDPTPADRSGFAGTLGRVFFWAFAPSATWIRASYRAQADQVAVLGVSAENLRGITNRGPVAIPLQGTAVAGSPTTPDIDVAARAFDPNANLLTASLTGVTPPTQGTAAIFGNKLRYTPVGGTGGQTHRVAFRVADASLSSTSIVDVDVTPPVVEPPPPTGGEFPSSAGFTVRNVNTVGEFDAAYAASSPGDHVVAANGLNIPARSFGRSGSTANPIVIRSASNQGAAFTGTLTITGSNMFFWGFKGIRMRNKTSPPANRGITIRRMLFNEGVTDGIYVTGEMYTLDFRAEYCTFCNAGAGVRFNNLSRNGTIIFSHWFNIAPNAQVNGRDCLTLLEGKEMTFVNGNFLISDCLFENCCIGGRENETISNKCSNNTFRRLQFDRTRDMNIRFGNNCQMLGVVCPPGTNGNMSARGNGHIWNNCVGTISLDDGNYDNSRNPPPDVPGEGDFPNCTNATIIGGPAGDLIDIGSEGRNFRVTGTRIEGRGSNPNVRLGVGSAPTVIPTTNVALVARANFPLGQGFNNTDVGVRGGL